MDFVDVTKRKKKIESNNHGLIDKMLSWSLDDIDNEELYKNKVPFSNPRIF